MPTPSVDAITNALRGVIDPELHDNLVDLGMIRGIDVEDDGRTTVHVALTIAGCPLRTQIRKDVESHVASVPGVREVKVRTSEMTGAEKAALMSRARLKAQDTAPDTDIPDTTRIVAISSGKGGVGKSSVTANLAVSLAARGFTVGVLDADIGGFSIPRMLGTGDRMEAEKGEDGRVRIRPLDRAVGSGRLKIVSMGSIQGAEEDQAIMLRGLMLNRALQHFLEDVRWGAMDYLLVDMPPGTSDIQMGLARMLPRTEVVIVTTPALAAQKVAARAADMATKGHLRIAGVVENMSSFLCDHGERYALFGEGGGARLAAEIGVPLLGQVPLDPAVAAGGDSGQPVVAVPGSAAAAAFDAIADRMVTEAVPPIELAGCTARMEDLVERLLGPKPVA
jgi:ATP-binding protein involved in chromosome partitioning